MSQFNPLIAELRAAFHSDVCEEILERVLVCIDELDASDSPEEMAVTVLPYIQDGLARWVSSFETVELNGSDEIWDDDDPGTLAQRVVALHSTMARWNPVRPVLQSVTTFLERECERERIHGDVQSEWSRVRFEMTYRLTLLRTEGEVAMNRVKIPLEFMAYLDAMRTRWWRARDSPYALKLYSCEGMLLNTSYLASTFAHEWEEPQGPWLVIGDWSDKHDTMLCCDERSTLWGQVHDFHDAHPWLNGEEGGSCEAHDFASYLAEISSMSSST